MSHVETEVNSRRKPHISQIFYKGEKWKTNDTTSDIGRLGLKGCNLIRFQANINFRELIFFGLNPAALGKFILLYYTIEVLFGLEIFIIIFYIPK